MRRVHVECFHRQAPHDALWVYADTDAVLVSDQFFCGSFQRTQFSQAIDANIFNNLIRKGSSKLKKRQKFAKSLDVDFQTLAGFTNLRYTKNGQCFAHDCIV